MSLIIRRKSLKVWTHEFNGRPAYISPKANFNTPNETFLIIEQFGSKLGVYNSITKRVEGVPIVNITVYDDLNSGIGETFSTATQLSLRLEALNYPSFFKDGDIASINNLIIEGDGIIFTGSGTLLDPYRITASAGTGGYVPVNIRSQYNGTSVTVPLGFILNRIIDLNDINNNVTGVVTGTTMPITGGVTDNIYLIDGYKL